MQLASKMRFIAAQFSALLSDDLWRLNASHANQMARRLANGLADVEGVRLAYPVEANGVFAVIPPEVAAALQTHYPFYVWDESASIVRLMASFDTSEDDVDGFIKH